MEFFLFIVEVEGQGAWTLAIFASYASYVDSHKIVNAMKRRKNKMEKC
jgi:hypothetical protein